MSIEKDLEKYIEHANFVLNSALPYLEKTSYSNHEKILEAFKQVRINQSHFQISTGYGYGDLAREGLEELYSSIFKSEQALVRTQIASGTHAIACCLFGLLQPGDDVVSITGTPYDTLHPVIGHKTHTIGSLTYYGVKYSEIPLDNELKPDKEKIRSTISKLKPKLVMLQRSRGYSWRPSISIAEIEELINIVKQVSPQTICFVDNCYGEFVEEKEPIEVGADIIAGSLIKNPGGGLAPAGGYIVGKKEYVESAAYRLTAPGIGDKVGATLTDPRLLYQGLFMSPHIVKEALISAIYAASMFDSMHFEVNPKPAEFRTDIIQAVKLPSSKMMVSICKAIQQTSPIDSFLTPEPSPMAGYDTEVIMAGGTFVQGSSIELSADGPMAEPSILYLQGSLTSEHGKITINHILNQLISKQVTV